LASAITSVIFDRHNRCQKEAKAEAAKEEEKGKDEDDKVIVTL